MKSPNATNAKKAKVNQFPFSVFRVFSGLLIVWQP